MRNLSDSAKKKQYEQQRRWHKENYSRISIALKKEDLERYKRLCDFKKVSMSSLIKGLLESEYEREKKNGLL